MSDLREGVCPKCGSSEVYCALQSNPVQVGLRSITLYFYVCTDCGSTENYLFDVATRQHIAKNWLRVDGEKKKKNDDEKRKNDEL